MLPQVKPMRPSHSDFPAPHTDTMWGRARAVSGALMQRRITVLSLKDFGSKSFSRLGSLLLSVAIIPENPPTSCILKAAGMARNERKIIMMPWTMSVRTAATIPPQ